jgi:predicted enzyme related to lactoylglutathione lyase
MLTSRPIKPILPVTDLERAKKFYSASLGLRPGKATMPDTAVFEAGAGMSIELLKRERPTKAEHTAISFEVDDVEREVKELESRAFASRTTTCPASRPRSTSRR